MQTNLLAMDRASMEEMFADMGERGFRARQVLRWIYKRGITSIDAMTDLAKPLRARLQADAGIALPQIARRQTSRDGTVKWLLRLADGNCIESVFIPENTRATLCVSSQVGCALNCSFCATAKQGFNRNLGVDEIIGQVWLANRELRAGGDAAADAAGDSSSRNPITNIVLMGMGEPLLNFDNVTAAMRLMTDDYSFGLSRRRVTLSTAGLVPAIDKLAEVCPVSLAVSLHAPDDALRNELVPLNKKYPIAELLAACRRYLQNTDERGRARVTFEYVLLAGVNDSAAQAKALAKLLGGLPAKVNLIPFNAGAGIDYRRPSADAVNRFRDILVNKNIFTVTRKTRGDDIDAACGQLAGKVLPRVKKYMRAKAAPVAA